LEHALHEILELIAEESISFWLVLAMSFPEDISSVGSQTSVEWVSWLGSGEWWMLSYHNEKDNGSSEQIY